MVRSTTPSMTQFSLRRSFPFVITGLLLGIAIFIMWSEGYFVTWERLPDPPETPISLVSTSDIAIVATESAGQFALWDDQWIPLSQLRHELDLDGPNQECTHSWPQFSPLAGSPSDLLACVQIPFELPDGSIKTRLVGLDAAGLLWEWSHAPLSPSTFYLCAAALPTYGLMLGFTLAVALWVVRMLINRRAA